MGAGGKARGLERNEDFRRRTGPGPEGGMEGGNGSGIWDKSAMSQGDVE